MVGPRKPSAPISLKISRSNFSCRCASVTRGISFSWQYARALSRTMRSSSVSWSSSRMGSSHLKVGFMSLGFMGAPAGIETWILSCGRKLALQPVVEERLLVGQGLALVEPCPREEAEVAQLAASLALDAPVGAREPELEVDARRIGFLHDAHRPVRGARNGQELARHVHIGNRDRQARAGGKTSRGLRLEAS